MPIRITCILRIDGPQANCFRRHKLCCQLVQIKPWWPTSYMVRTAMLPRVTSSTWSVEFSSMARHSKNFRTCCSSQVFSIASQRMNTIYWTVPLFAQRGRRSFLHCMVVFCWWKALTRDQTNQPLLFRDRISNCTNLFWPEPYHTRRSALAAADHRRGAASRMLARR